VFTAGGDENYFDGLVNGLNGMHLFDRNTEKYINGAKMQRTRWYPTTIRMPNNDYWIIGGQVTGNQYQVQNNMDIVSE
jgi:hypothetical protein